MIMITLEHAKLPEREPRLVSTSKRTLICWYVLEIVADLRSGLR